MAVSKKKTTANETTARHLWLAGLGVLAVSRREAIATAGRVADGIGALKQRVERGAADAQANVRHGLDGMRDQVEPTLVKFSTEVESRLAPVLAKLGLDPRGKAPRKARKQAARKPTRRTAVRKPAKAAKRVARKPGR